MTDQQIGVLAVAVWCAALAPIGDSLAYVAPGAVVAVAAWWFRRPLVLIVALVLVAATSAGASWAGIEPGAAQRYEGVVRLATDPEPVPGGIRVHADIEGNRYVLRAWGSPAGWLRNRLMGETIGMQATLRPLGDVPDWMRAQGLSGRGTVTSVAGFDVGRPHTRIANSIRRTIESGAAPLDRDEMSLFTGLVYGDDRSQSSLVADNFDAAGLTHLLAVSGQNVAFVLAIAGPLLRRFGYRRRFLFVVAILLLFATVTRFEPSVVRASVMTAVAAVGALVGTEVSSRRVLSLAIVALVILDPLIVHRVAFQLSVAASAGILFWSARVARAIPGPRWLAEAVALTSTAQLAVAPLLVWRFDGLPVASLPANVLAGPVAGPIMMWGLTAGLLAGLVPAAIGAVIHIPTKLGVWWIDNVAALAPGLPLGRLEAVHIAAAFLVGTVWLRSQTKRRRVVAAAVLIAVIVQPAVSLAVAPATSQAIDTQSTIWRDEQRTVVVIDSSTRSGDVLAAMRTANVGDIDLIVLRQDARSNAALVGWLRTRHDIQQVWAPATSLGVGETRPFDGSEFLAGGFRLTVAAGDDELVVRAELAHKEN